MHACTEVEILTKLMTSRNVNHSEIKFPILQARGWQKTWENNCYSRELAKTETPEMTIDRRRKTAVSCAGCRM